MLKAHVRKSVGSIPTDCIVYFFLLVIKNGWGCSSLGRAVGSQSAGTGIETLLLHSFLGGGAELPTKKEATPTRFELARAEPSRFLIYLLNHSDTVSGSKVWVESNHKKGGDARTTSCTRSRNHHTTRPITLSHTKREEKKKRQRRDSNSRGQSPVDFESTSLTTRTRCRVLYEKTHKRVIGLVV
jgi:hypothetical protein